MSEFNWQDIAKEAGRYLETLIREKHQHAIAVCRIDEFRRLFDYAVEIQSRYEPKVDFGPPRPINVPIDPDQMVATVTPFFTPAVKIGYRDPFDNLDWSRLPPPPSLLEVALSVDLALAGGSAVSLPDRDKIMREIVRDRVAEVARELLCRIDQQINA